jgi:type IV secretory pathway VirD2 relaxase
MSSERDVPRPRAFARRCIVKARFVPMNTYGARAAALHLAYIERDGVEQDGSPGRIYGPADVADVRESLSSPIESEKRQFRFIVSPEDGVDVGLTAFTRRLMSQMESDLGRKLVWGAVNHWNTDNPHIHVVVRGLDADGRDLTIDGRYISEGLRGRAQSILTNELGPRTELQIRDQIAREVDQERFTSLDRTLQGCVGPDHTVLETWLPTKDRASWARLVARLARLERMGLVARMSPVEWRFDERWVETLRGLGQAKDIIKRMHAALPAPDPSRFIILDQSVFLQPVDGVVRCKGLHDEIAGQAFAVIEAVDGRAFYTRIDLPTAERIRENDVVRLSVAPQEPRAQAAQASPPRFRVRLQRLGPPIAIQRRYRGPTWLDNIDGARLPQPARGFAAELAGSLRQRSANVRAMGITSADHVARVAGLASLEARTVGALMAAQRGFTLVAASSGVAGTLTLSPRLPSGLQYAVVADESSKQLCVVLAGKELRLLDGQTVELSRTLDGRIAVSRAPPTRTPDRGPDRGR